MGGSSSWYILRYMIGGNRNSGPDGDWKEGVVVIVVCLFAAVIYWMFFY